MLIFAVSDPKFPTPEELQQRLTEFMKSNFGDNVTLTAFTAPEPAGTGPLAAERAPVR